MSDDAQTPEADAAGGGGKLWPPPVNEDADVSGGSGQSVPPETTPWPAPVVPGSDHQTVTSIPTLGDQPAPAPRPWATPSGSTPPPFTAPPPPSSSNGAANPFAAPAPGQERPVVPPPPIAPDGPGQVPYGYPGAYGYPGHGPGYGGGPQPQGYYGWQGMGPVPPRNGMGTAGLVLGIIAAVCFCMWPLAILLGVLGVVFGANGRAKARRGEATNSGQALAGIICGAFGIALGAGFAVLIFTSG